MNKLFTKIAALALGATMAVGVGVAVASSGKEAIPAEAAASYAFSGNTLTFSSQGLSNDTQYTGDFTNAASDNTFKVNFTGGGNDGKYYTTGTGIRTYGGGSVNVTALGGKTLTEVVFTFSGSSYAAPTGNISGYTLSNATGTWSGSASSISLTRASGSGHWRLQKVKATVSGSTTYTVTITVNNSDYGSVNKSSVTSVASGTSISASNNVLTVGTNTVTATATTSTPQFTYAFSSWSGIPAGATVTSNITVTANFTRTANPVSSLAITGSMTKTTYTQGDAWDPSGFTVNAYYSSSPSTPVDVTSSVEWSYSPATTASTSTTSVTCTASFGGKSATSSAQSVTINEKQNLGGLVDGEKYFIIANGYYLQSFNNAPPAAAGTAVTWPGDDNMPEEDTNAWTVTSTGNQDNWIITSQAGNTLYATATNNGLGCTSSGNDNWTVIDSGTNGLKLQASGGRYLTCYPSGTNFRTYTSTSSQTEVNSTVRFVKYEEPVTLDSLTISGATSTFTAGDYFSLGSPTITATYSTGAESIAANDSGLSFKLGGNAITTSTRLTSSDNGKSLVVRYTDSENRYADATGYTLTVNPKPVQSVTLDKASVTITKGGTVQLTATVSDEYAIQTVKWTTSDSSIATVGAATSTSGDAITVTGSSSNAGSATITAYVDENDNGSLDSGEKSATCAITVSGDPVLNMLDDEENVISSESFHAFTTDSNIYLHVDAENFVGAITYTWSSSNTSAIAIVEEADEMCEFDIVGAGTNVRLSCHAVGATSGNLTTYVDYTVTEPQVDEVTWSAPATLSVYDNASLTAANITSWSPAYHKDNGESGSISSGYTVKLGGTTISLSYPWDVEDDGEELWIEYGGIASSHVTVQVTEHLNAISYSSWSLVTDVSDLSAGDVIIIANADKGKAMASTALKAGETLEATDVTITDGEVTSEVPSGTARFTLGGNSSDGWSFKCGDNYLYFSTTNNSRTMDLKESSSSYNITIDGETGDAIIGGTMRVVLNTGVNPVRWSSYNTATETASMNFAEIYKSTSSNIADTNATAQRALLSYVATFNSTMDCDDGGSTTNVESKWSSASSAFTTAMNALGTDDKAVFKRLVANASAVEGGDSLQDMLARYDYIIAKYKLDNDFLHTAADRAEVAQRGNINLITIINSKTDVNVVAIVVITSVISLTAIGGYFFLRKRREQN